MEKTKILIVGIIMGLLLSGIIVYAENIISGNLVRYNNENSQLSAMNVQDAIDEIYHHSKKVLCKRATTLHTENCDQATNFCARDGYAQNELITYGNDPKTRQKGVLESGDAFDCDVDGKDGYNSVTERFYYVTDLDNYTAVLIFYNNTVNGSSDNTTGIAYHVNNHNYEGPISAVKELPTTNDWQTRVYSNPRQITNQNGETNNGTLPVYNYAHYAARLLTYQEVSSACSNLATAGSLKNCNYLMENTKYSSNDMGTYGHWLETPDDSDTTNVWSVRGDYSFVRSRNADFNNLYGIRPAIEVLKSDIAF